jgi:hypothetical protein
MKEETQDNMLIAEFMGNKMNGVFYISGYDANFPTQRLVHPNDLEYHESWDWLMPVVEKIRLLGNTVDISTNYFSKKYPINNGCRINENTQIPKLFIFKENKDILINCVYEAIIEFIKRYNENKSK